MAHMGETFEMPPFPPKESDFTAIKKHRTVQTAFGEVPLSWKFWFRKSWIKYWVLLVMILVLVILMTVYHHQIVNWLRPWAQKFHDLPGGWAIPIGVLFVISFPPLFGHEVVAVLCGLVWGLWVGFGIVSAGTLLGEWGNFFAFRYFLQNKARTLEQKDINFACMTRLVERGGFWIVFLARLSAIPGHLTTAVFATTRMSFWTFTLAAVLTMPKQLMVVYLGTIFDEEEAGTRSTASKVVTDVVLVFSFLVTIGVAVYLYRKMSQVRPEILAERRLKAQEAGDMSPAEAYGAKLSAYPRDGQGTSDESLALAKNGSHYPSLPSVSKSRRTAVSPAGYTLPYSSVPYAHSQYDVSSASLQETYPSQQWRPEAPPSIVVQPPSDATLRSAPAPDLGTLAQPPPRLSSPPHYEQARADDTYGQAI